MMRKYSLILVCFLLSVMNADAQIRKIPVEVTNAFTTQYPEAKDVSYGDKLKDFEVEFSLGGEKMTASYNSKGVWKGTEKTTSLSNLPQAVQDGFQKSKYADWEVKEATIFYFSGNTEKYRLKVEKGELQRKHLHFNKNGRLTKDSITI